MCVDVHNIVCILFLGGGGFLGIFALNIGTGVWYMR